MPNRWSIRLLKELAFVVIIGTPVLLFFLVMSPRSHATRLLRQLRVVEVNRTSFHQVEALAAQYSPAAACVGDNCLFQFQNLWLHWLRLAPRTEFTVMLRRAGSSDDPGGGRVGVLDMAMLVSQDMSATNAANDIASALMFDEMSEQGVPSYRATINFNNGGQPGRTVVRLSPRAKASQRRQARGFNLSCLTRIGGCRTSRQLLPTVWQGAQRIQSASKRSATTSTLAAVN
ncbi:MAG: hypothetical protein ACRD1C_02625 [Terriglobales bacterium]